MRDLRRLAEDYALAWSYYQEAAEWAEDGDERAAREDLGTALVLRAAGAALGREIVRGQNGMAAWVDDTLYVVTRHGGDGPDDPDNAWEILMVPRALIRGEPDS